MAKVRIFATGKDGERIEVGGYLYFFEEQCIHDLSGDGCEDYKIEIEIDDVLIEITEYTKYGRQ